MNSIWNELFATVAMKEIAYSQGALQDGDEATIHAISDNSRLRKRKRNKTM